MSIPRLRRRLPVLAAVLCGAAAWGQSRFIGDMVTARPIAASLEQILSTPRSEWRGESMEVYRWDLFPRVLVFDTATYTFQDRMFSRIAFFLEKKGFRGRLLTNEDLEGRHGWNAHDYSAEGLASFFNSADAIGLPLNPEEWTLLAIALRQNVVARRGGRFLPGEGAILSISQSSEPILRRLLLTHESFHGIFFTSAGYREHCFRLWADLAPEQKLFLRLYLDSLGYDTSDRTLEVNEVQAYLMQQPLSYARAYFERAAGRMEGRFAPEGIADELYATARRLSDFTAARFGLAAGGVLVRADPPQR